MRKRDQIEKMLEEADESMYNMVIKGLTYNLDVVLSNALLISRGNFYSFKWSVVHSLEKWSEDE